MTQQQPVPQEGGIKGAVTRPIGPLPVWQWAVLIVGAYLVWRYVGGGGGASSTTTTVPATTTDTGSSGSSGGTGTSTTGSGGTFA